MVSRRELTATFAMWPSLKKSHTQHTLVRYLATAVKHSKLHQFASCSHEGDECDALIVQW